jgi:hypothetical protein
MGGGARLGVHSGYARASQVCGWASIEARRPSRSKQHLRHLRPSAALYICAHLWLAVGCAASLPKRPQGPGAQDAAALTAFEEATRSCIGLKTLTAELRLSGRAAGERLRGTLHAGFGTPAALRLEAVAPFGPPVFILAGRNNSATLFFPRDNRVLAGVALADVLDRLTALPLNADDLRLVLTGCLVESATPTQGRAWNGGWFAVALRQDVTAYLQQRNGSVVVAAADYGPWLIDYADHLNGWPRTVRIRSKEPQQVDAIARLDQLEVNTPLDDKAFDIEIPADAERITLNDLRAVAPLRELRTKN